jgi:dipeptidyl aminopeptidase/acylaminoacyl peptidase
LHGEKDEFCPVSQAHAFYRALMDRGVAVEAVLYPGEGHSIRSRSHRLDIEERIIHWLEKYL